MRNSLVILFVFLVSGVLGQNKLIPTDQFSIEGKVEHPAIFTLALLDTFKTKSLPDVVITNHVGVVKNTLTKLKGISVKDILANVSLQAENPKVLSEFYFVFVATDNYKIVFSWNEIFNTETGNNIYIVTEEGGKKINEMDKRISMICTTDFKTGRRDLRNLQKIIVERAN
jgi:hypothetical protein